MPRTRKTVAPGLLVIRTLAALNGERRAMTPARPPAGRDLEFRAEPPAEHRGDFRLRNALARHPNLCQGALPRYESSRAVVRARSLRNRAAVVSSLSEAA